MILTISIDEHYSKEKLIEEDIYYICIDNVYHGQILMFHTPKPLAIKKLYQPSFYLAYEILSLQLAFAQIIKT